MESMMTCCRCWRSTGAPRRSSTSCSGRCVSARRRSRSSRTLSVICRCISSRSESRRCDCTPRTTGSKSGHMSPHHRDQSTDFISQAEVCFFYRHRELEDRKKIQHLLALVGPDPGEITYFHREPPHKVTVPQKKVLPRSHEESKGVKPRPVSAKGSKKSSREGEDATISEQYKRDNQTLLLQVEALQAQLEEQTRLAKEQVEALLEDRRIHREERQVQHQRDQDTVTALTDKLQRTQNLLHESTRDFLQLKFESRAHEKSWMLEKDRLLRELDSCQERLREERGFPEQPPPLSADVPLISQPKHESSHTHREEIRALREELKQAHKLADMYREQCVNLETDLSQIREEGDVGREIFKERSDKMANRLQLMTKRYEALEKRRAMEVEGFKTDIKLLRQKVKDVEKYLFKLTLNVGPDQDLAILHEVRQTNSRTVKVQSELKNLRAKIYKLENDLRFC
uniref:Coiled-coil domain containing 77 n=2 Tax=Cyprinus carpio TaxID=7962 RepID=A0A9J7ZH63_CYPCA